MGKDQRQTDPLLIQTLSKNNEALDKLRESINDHNSTIVGLTKDQQHTDDNITAIREWQNDHLKDHKFIYKWIFRTLMSLILGLIGIIITISTYLNFSNIKEVFHKIIFIIRSII